MGDLISRQEVLDEINRIGNGAFTEYAYYSNLFDFVCDLPSVELERKFIEKVFETLREMDDAVDVICNLDVDAVLDRMEVDR